jgi:WD40 repeat protein
VYFIQTSAIYSMAFAPDGDALITVGTDGCVRRTIIEPKRPFREVTVNKWNSAAYQNHSGTGLFVVVANEAWRLDQPKQGGLPERYSLAYYPPTTTVSDGTLVAGFAEGHLGILKLATGEVVLKLRFDREWVGRPVLSPDASQVAAVSRDKNGQRLDVLTLSSKTWECYTSDDPLWAYFCIDDGLVTWVNSTRQIVIFNIKDKTVRGTTKPGEVPGDRAALSPDRQWLMSMNGQDLALVDCKTCTVVYRTRCEHTVNSLAFSADGRSFVVAGPQGQLSIWQTATGQHLFQIASLGAPTHSLHPLDDRVLAAVAGATDGHTVHTWYEF